MKKILKLLAVALIAAPLALSSCSDDNTDPTPGPGPGPVGPGTETDQYGNTINKGENAYAPIRWAEGDYKTGDTGVSIEISETTLKNVVFQVKPGSRVKSYKLDIYPLSQVYSTMQNSRCDAQGNLTTEKFTVEQTTDILRQLIQTGITNDKRDLLFTAEKLENYADAEFDWAFSPYYFIHLVPDARYLILAQGYYDEAATEPCADLTVCHFSTKTQDLVGDPQIEVEATEGYFGVSTIHYPNADAPYFYYFAGDKNGPLGCDTYIDLFGQRMWIDFIRHYYVGEPAAREGDELNAAWMMQGAAGHAFFWSAIPLDVNQVPNIDGFVQRDLIVKEIPTDLDLTPIQSIEPDKTHMGADTFWYNYKQNDCCARLHYNIFPKEDVEKIQAMSEEEKTKFAEWLTNISYAVVNRNYRYDGEKKQILGTGDEGTQIDWDCRFDHAINFSMLGNYRPTPQNMEAGKEYVLVSAGINPYYQYSDIHVSQPFALKELVRDQPAQCEANVNLELSLLNRNGISFKFTYDYGKAAMIYFNWYGDGRTWDKADDSILTKETDRATWLKFLLDERMAGEGGPNAIPWANIWAGDNVSGIENYGLAGLEQDHTYKIAYCATDLNGVVGEIKFAELHIPAIIGGMNPTTTITCDYLNGTYKFKFTSNEDMINFKYCIVDATRTSAALGYLHTGEMDYDEYIQAWTRTVAVDGMEANSLSYTYDMAGLPDPSVALAIPYGKDLCEGELAYLLYADGEFHSDLKAYLDKQGK